MSEYVSKYHRQEMQAELRREQLREHLLQLGLNEAQYEVARRHPIYFEVLRLAMNEEPFMNFWAAQYKWLGIAGETIDLGGIVTIEFHHTTFDEERKLYLSMFD